MKTYLLNKSSFGAKNKLILAMGPESDGNFSIYQKGRIGCFSGYGDLLEESNFNKYKKDLLGYLEKEDLKPDIIIVDNHPLFKTAELGKELADKFESDIIGVQHHQAHIFSSVIDKMIHDKDFIPNKIIGIASDGTGYHQDGSIWGGEVLRWQMANGKWQIDRIGSLEEQIMIGGEMAIKEPARMLLSILLKNDDPSTKLRMTPFFSEKDLNVLIKQYEQNFNCLKTTSTGRVLDAVSVLLGFSNNKREYKHQPIDLLEQNSTKPYDLAPEVFFDTDLSRQIISTSALFKYLVDNLNKDKKRLAATAQVYLANGFWEIVKEDELVFFSGGMAKNKIMSEFLKSKGVYINKKIPCNDAGISMGQIGSYLLTS